MMEPAGSKNSSKRKCSSGGCGSAKKTRGINSAEGALARRRRLEIRRFQVIANTNNSQTDLPPPPAAKKPRGMTHDQPQPQPQPQQKLQHQLSNGWHFEHIPESLDHGGSSGSSSGGSSALTAELEEEQEQSLSEHEKLNSNNNSSGGTAGTAASSEASGGGGTARSQRCVAADCPPPHGAVFICGRRREMEDAVAVVPSFMTVPCGTVGGCDCHPSVPPADRLSLLHFFGVYDGHGGAQVAAYCKEHLHAAVVEELAMVDSSVPTAEIEERLKKSMVASFLKVDSQVGGFGNSRRGSSSSGSGSEGEESPSSAVGFVAPETSGSTAVVAVVGSNRIIVANCGDSRAVLCRGGRAIPLSRDHKPDHDDELARVEAAGGRVIFWNGYRVLGVLAMSRAIGDRYLKPFIIPEPDVTCTDRSEEDECLILASDGLWDVLTNEVVCEITRKCLSGRHRAHQHDSEESNADLAAGLLTKFAIAKGSCDNISVVVVDLRSGRRS